MRVVAVYKQNTDHTRAVETFLEDFARRTGKALDTLDPDSIEGEIFCRAHDIVEYPTIIALSNESQMLSVWRGAIMPTISEVSYYASQD